MTESQLKKLTDLGFTLNNNSNGHKFYVKQVDWLLLVVRDDFSYGLRLPYPEVTHEDFDQITTTMNYLKEVVNVTQNA